MNEPLEEVGNALKIAAAERYKQDSNNGDRISEVSSLVDEAADYVYGTSALAITTRPAAQEIAWAFAEGLRAARGYDDLTIGEAARLIGRTANI